MVNLKLNNKMKKEEIEDEFYRIAEMWVRGNSLDVLTDMISLKDKKQAIKDFHSEDYLDED
jgi:hypothetical protein